MLRGKLRAALAVVVSAAALPAVALPAAADPGGSATLSTLAAQLPRPLQLNNPVELSDGSVLVFGAATYGAAPVGERYSPGSLLWQDAAPEPTPRFQGTAVPLPDGTALLLGGYAAEGLSDTRNAAIYDPAANTWTELASQANGYPTVLSDGKVFLAASGGATLFDPRARSFTAVPALPDGTTASSTVAALPGGRALLAGAPSYRYDDGTNTWSVAASQPDTSPYDRGGGLSLVDGDVLTIASTYSAGSLLYDPASDAWGSASPPPYAYGGRSYAQAGDGEVVAVDSSTQNNDPQSADVFVYDPVDDAWTTSPQPQTVAGSAVPLGDGTVLVLSEGVPTVQVVSVNGGPPQRTMPPGPPAGLSLVDGPRDRQGATVAWSGRLTRDVDAAPLAGETVTLYEQPAAGGAWSAVGSATTDAEGGASITATDDGPANYVLRHRGNDVASPAVSPVVALTAPTGPEVPLAPDGADAQPGDGRATFSWNAPLDDGGSAVTSYGLEVFPSDPSLGPETDVTVGGSASTTTVTGLQNGVRYDYFLSASNAAGQSLVVQGDVTPAAGAVPPVGTRVCGTLPAGGTTWSATASPYVVCSRGVTVGPASQLVLDGSTGPLLVEAAAGGEVYVGGSLTSTGAVTLDGLPGSSAGSWQGVVGEGGALDLGAAHIAHATNGIWQSFAFVHLAGTTVTDSSSAGIMIGTALTATGIDVERSGTNGVSDVYQAAYGEPDTVPVSITGSTVRDSGAAGLVVDSGGTPRVTGDVLDRNGTATGQPAASIVATTLHLAGSSPDVSLTGAGNAADAVVLSGLVQDSDSWHPWSNSGSEHPLGWVASNLTWAAATTLTVPAGAEVDGALGIFGSLDATAGHAHFGKPSAAGISSCLCQNDAGVTGKGVAPSLTFTGAVVDGPIGTPGYLMFAVDLTDAVATLTVKSSVVHGYVEGAGVVDVENSQTGELDGVGNGPSGSVRIVGDTVTGQPGDRALATGLPGLEGIRASSVPAGTVTVTGSTVTGVEGHGLDITGTQPTISGVVVRTCNDGGMLDLLGGAPGTSASTIGFPTGSGNGVNAVTVSGDLSGNLAAAPVPTGSADQPLGTELSGLTVHGPGTVTLPAGTDPVPVLSLDGASLAVQSGAHVTGDVLNALAPTGALPTGIEELARANGATPVSVSIAGSTVDVPVKLDQLSGVGTLSVTNSHLTTLTDDLLGLAARATTVTGSTGTGAWSLRGTTSLHVDGLALTGDDAGLSLQGPHRFSLPAEGAADDVTIHHVSVTGSTSTLPAVTIQGVRAGVGSGTSIDTITGASDAVPVVDLVDDTVLGGLTWITPTTGTTAAPLGFVSGTGTYGEGAYTQGLYGPPMLDIAGGSLVLPPGSIAKIGTVSLSAGATLVAQQGSLVAANYDSTVGVVTCTSCETLYDYVGNPAVVDVQNSSLTSGFTPGGGASVTGTQFNGPLVFTHSGRVPEPFVHIADSTVPSLSVTGGEAWLQRLHVGSVAVAGSPHAVVENVTGDTALPASSSYVDCGDCATVQLSDTQAYVHGLSGSVSNDSALVVAAARTGTVVECVDVAGTGSPQIGRDGIVADGTANPFLIRDSDLTGADYSSTSSQDLEFDLSSRRHAVPGAGGTVTTQGVWWGQAGGPDRSRQIYEVADTDLAPASVPATCPAVDAAQEVFAADPAPPTTPTTPTAPSAPAGPAAPSAPAVPAVTASAATATAGGTATLAGRVTSAGAAVAHAGVRVTVLDKTTKKKTTFTTTTDAAGRFAVTVKPAHTAQVTVDSDTATATFVLHVTPRVSVKAARKARTVTVTSAALGRPTVTVVAVNGRKRKVVGRVRLDAKGHAVLAKVVFPAGTKTVEVDVPASGGLDATRAIAPLR